MRMKGTVHILLLLMGLILFGELAFSIEEGLQDKTSYPKETHFMVLPVLFYMPETSLGFGAGALMTFNLGDIHNTRPSSLFVTAYYTLNKQYAFEIQPELYLKEDSYFMKAFIGISRFPSKYFGIGNSTPDSMEEPYTPQNQRVDLTIQKKLISALNLYAGIQYKYEQFDLLETDPEGRLKDGEIPGSLGGTLSGLGIILNRDSRDNIFFPRNGDYFQVSMDWYSSALGSDFQFTRLKLDLRKYFPLLSSHALAIQFLWESVSGTPPFHQYPLLGGEKIMRGYYTGRFRDNILAVLQAEYRFPLTKKLGGVVFAGLGQVADSLSSLTPGQLKYSVGIGLRYFLTPKETPCIRMDYGFGHKTSGFYFTFRDAF